MDIRHDIAHGANRRSDEITEVFLRAQADFMTKIANDVYQTIFDYTAELSCEQAISYSLTPKCYRDIIAEASQKANRIITLDDIRALGSSAQGNHNKLCYEPWGLLEVVDAHTRLITDRLIQFANGELRLPLRILVFDNNDSIPEPETAYILISELP